MVSQPGQIFIGRQQEMAKLRTALEDAFSGQGRMVMLAGEPGIGKTRTAQEVAALAESRGARVLWGWCYEEAGAPPYWPWVQPIRSYVREKDPEKLRSEMGPGAADVAEIVSEVAEALPDLEPPPALEPEQSRFRLFDSITTFLKNAAHSQPLLLVLEDLHWAERSSLLLLEFIVRQIDTTPLLVIGTYRDVEVSRRHPLSETLGNLIREQRFLRVQLPGLAQEEVEQLIQTTTGVSASLRLVESIHTRTEGNPLFVSEVIRVMQQEGIEEVQEGTSIPEGIRDAIGRRLNRLSELCNQTLTTASVIGREFNFELLQRLDQVSSEELLLETLDEAAAARLIEELPDQGDRYRFSHGLIQETLVEELTTSRRVRLHARIGEFLEELYSDAREDHSAELAHHFAEAEAVLGPAKYVRYALLAGERAIANYAYEEAVAHFERALATKEGPTMDAERAELLFGLGRAQAAIMEAYQWEEAVANLGSAFDYYVGVGEAARAVAVALTPLRPEPGRSVGVTQLLIRALEMVPSDSHEAGQFLSLYGAILGLEEVDYQGAQQAFHRALEIAQREKDATLEMRTLAEAARIDYFHLNYSESLEKSLRSIPLTQHVDDPNVQVNAHIIAAQALSRTGDLERARGHAASALAVAQRLRDRNLLSTAFWTSAIPALETGDWAAARDFSDRGLEVSPLRGPLLYNRVILEYEVGNFHQGEAYLQRLVELTQHAPQPSNTSAYTAQLMPLVDRITGTIGQLDEPRRLAEAVISSPSAVPRSVMIARSALALIAVLQGEVATAEKQYRALTSVSGTMVTDALAIDRLLGLLSQTMGNLDQAATPTSRTPWPSAARPATGSNWRGLAMTTQKPC